MDKDKYNLIAISGSLRKMSFNTTLLKYLEKNAPEEISINIIGIKDIPFYDQDIEDFGFPEEVKSIRSEVRNCDGIIFACPEYNCSVTGVLKNVIDWISRKDQQGYPFSKKPVMIIGATPGLMGTARAQKELRGILNNLNTFPMNKPELLVTEADKKIVSSEDIDEKIKEILEKMLDNFVKWIDAVNKFK